MSTAETQVILLAIRTMEEAGKDADAAAATHLLLEKARRLSEETVRRHQFDLALFARIWPRPRFKRGIFCRRWKRGGA